jgi:predicted small lipoprotein YifL
MYTLLPTLRMIPFFLLALLAACGQKGPLYRPDDRPMEVTAPETAPSGRKKSTPTPPAPQSQKEDRAPAPGDPTPAPPINDSDRAAPPAAPGT